MRNVQEYTPMCVCHILCMSIERQSHLECTLTRYVCVVFEVHLKVQQQQRLACAPAQQGWAASAAGLFAVQSGVQNDGGVGDDDLRAHAAVPC